MENRENLTWKKIARVCRPSASVKAITASLASIEADFLFAQWLIAINIFDNEWLFYVCIVTIGIASAIIWLTIRGWKERDCQPLRHVVVQAVGIFITLGLTCACAFKDSGLAVIVLIYILCRQLFWFVIVFVNYLLYRDNPEEWNNDRKLSASSIYSVVQSPTPKQTQNENAYRAGDLEANDIEVGCLVTHYDEDEKARQEAARQEEAARQDNITLMEHFQSLEAQKVPLRDVDVSFASIDDIPHSERNYQRFINSIFYIGKGKATQVYDHFVEAKKLHQNRSAPDEEMSSKTCNKTQRILNIWDSGRSVMVLHVFENSLSEEAYTREAAMIRAMKDAMKDAMIDATNETDVPKFTNKCGGTYYRVAKEWNPSRHSRLGRYLLKEAMVKL
uniref:Uncharacterized protein n=1 Tax=Plectus sambesii TaxID=2011161 RepID=A0A914X7C3_9BILA